MEQFSNTLLQRNIDISCWYLNLLQLVPALCLQMNNFWLVFNISYVLFHPCYIKALTNTNAVILPHTKVKWYLYIPANNNKRLSPKNMLKSYC